MNRRNQKITTYFVILSLLVIGIVYAILQANLQINGIAKIKSNTWDIHFNNIQINNDSVSIGTGDSPATIDPNDTSKVDFSVTLSTPGDFYEFTVDVVNAGTIDGMIELLTQEMKVNNEVVQKTPNYLNYIVTYEDDSSILLKHLLEAGETLTYKVRLEFKTDIEELPEAATINSSFGVQFVQADDTAIKKLPYYACTFDGELVQGAEYTNGQYTYRYMQEYGYNYFTNSSEWQNIENDGWGVRLSDPTSTEPVTTKLCTSINDKPIVSMKYMFQKSKTTNIDISSFDTSNVTNMAYMFSNCSSLTNIDVSSFNTSSVTNMGGMFQNCSSLIELDLSNFDFRNYNLGSLMMQLSGGFSKLKILNMTGAKLPSNLTYAFGGLSTVEQIILDDVDTSLVTNMSAMFNGCSNLLDIDVTNFDTSNVTNMSYMFSSCSSLASINVVNFDTSKVTDMSGMFSGCSSLASINVINFDTSKVTDMSGMFSGCSSLTELDLSGFDLRASNSFGSIAAGIFNGTSSLKKLNLSNMKLPSDMSHVIFRNGAASSSPIEEIDVTGWDLSNTTNVSGMFAANGSNGLGGSGLKRIIGLDTWDTSHITNMSQMFQGLSSLTTLDLSSFNTSNVTNSDDMFKNCTSLTTGYARTSADATMFNNSTNKPSNITFVVKS